MISCSISRFVGLENLNTELICQLQLQPLRIITHQCRYSMMLGIEVRRDWQRARVIQRRYGRPCIRLRRPVHLDRKKLPPWLENAFARRHGHDDSLRAEPTRKLDSKGVTFFEVVAHAIVQIERSFAIHTRCGWWIHAQRQRSNGFHVCALDQRLLRHNRSSSYKNRQSLQGAMDVNFRLRNCCVVNSFASRSWIDS